MSRTDRRRALITFALGAQPARDLIDYATHMYGDETFAVDVVYRHIREWVAREQAADVAAVRELTALIHALDDRAAAYEEELRDIHERELEQAKRNGWR